jgi:3-hydroxyisobutyrate dehydrogenase
VVSSIPADVTIGFAGLGRMGAPMCANLVRAGRRVLATDVRPEASVAGARRLPDLPRLAAESDVLITMLPGPAEVADAMNGALGSLRPGTVWIDMSSNDPAVVAPVRERVLARGVEVLEAPVGGGVEAARAGTLRIFAGGEEAVFARCRPVLEILADPAQVVRVGGHGAGYTAKLLVNLLWFGQAVATAEALLLGTSAGLELGTLREVLAGSAAESAFIRRDLPALLGGDYLTSFGLDRCVEELAAVTSLARAHGVPFALSELVEDVHRQALERFGTVDGELLAVALLEERTGRRLRVPDQD